MEAGNPQDVVEELQTNHEETEQAQGSEVADGQSDGLVENATPPDPENLDDGGEDEAPDQDAAIGAPADEQQQLGQDVNPGVKDESAAPVEVTPPAMTEPAAEDIQDSPASNGASENQVYLENIRANGLPIQKQALDTLELFCKRMVPRAPLSEASVLEAQRDLLDFITVLLRKEYEEFRKGWSVLLVYFAEYHGERPTVKNYSALSEYSTSRHLDRWSDESRASAYNNLVTLLRITRNAETRKDDAKRILIEKIAPGFLSEHSHSNLQRFYS